MLTPDYLSRIAEGSEHIASQLHEYIIRQISDRMMIRIGRGKDYLLTSADQWRIRIIQDAGYLLEDITAELAQYTQLQQQEITEAMQDAGIKALEYDHEIYKAAGLSPIPLWQSPNLVRLMERNYRITLGEWKNYTRTTAEAAQRIFINQCDLAYHKVSSGAVSYTQAVREAVDAVSADGVYVHYPRGRTDTIETATARAVRTGVAQASAQITMKRMEEMEWGIVLVSAHVGARNKGGIPENHELWQGKFYSLPQYDHTFQDFYYSTGYGDIAGLCGVNCRHSFGPGNGKNNPYKEIGTEENKRVYDLEQRQRALERQIRKTKRAVMGMQEAVEKCQDDGAKRVLQDSLDRKSYLLGKQNESYREFCRDNNMRPLNERLQIAKWSRKEASKAVAAARRYEKR